MNQHTPVRRKSTNVSLDPKLVDQAKALGINVSRACESGLSAELKSERERQWLEENGKAIKAWNEWVRVNGLPLEKYRQF
jgi:antitoxin CcdA